MKKLITISRQYGSGGRIIFMIRRSSIWPLRPADIPEKSSRELK